MAEGPRDRTAVRRPAAAAAATPRRPLNRDASARRIGLARDPWRILAWLGVRLAIGEVGILVGLATPGTIGTAVLVVGVTVLAYVLLLTVHVLTLRVDIRGGDLTVASALSRRRHRLQAGEVRRLAVDAGRGVFATQLGSFGIEIGQGRTPSGETLDVVRLSPDASVLVVPALPRPVAVAPSSPSALIRALARSGIAGPPNEPPAPQRVAVEPSR